MIRSLRSIDTGGRGNGTPRAGPALGQKSTLSQAPLSGALCSLPTRVRCTQRTSSSSRVLQARGTVSLHWLKRGETVAPWERAGKHQHARELERAWLLQLKLWIAAMLKLVGDKSNSFVK